MKVSFLLASNSAISLNFIDSSVESELMESIRDVDEDLANTIQDLMFVFDNLLEVDDRGIQVILREVESETLILALKGADPDMQEKVFKNMSSRAADMLKDDLEAKGPVRVSEVEVAQKEILAVADYYSIADFWWINSFKSRICFSSIYIHNLLK